MCNSEPTHFVFFFDVLMYLHIEHIYEEILFTNNFKYYIVLTKTLKISQIATLQKVKF